MNSSVWQQCGFKFACKAQQAGDKHASKACQSRHDHLGCAKNLVDAEVMLGSVCNAGWKSLRAQRTPMCSWLTLALHRFTKEESIEAIWKRISSAG